MNVVVDCLCDGPEHFDQNVDEPCLRVAKPSNAVDDLETLEDVALNVRGQAKSVAADHVQVEVAKDVDALLERNGGSAQWTLWLARLLQASAVEVVLAGIQANTRAELFFLFAWGMIVARTQCVIANGAVLF